MLIGAGDAMAFLSVMRLLPYWFPLRHAPVFAQVSAGLGQLGQFISAVPFLALLGARGWVVSFVSLGTAMLVVAGAAAVAISDTPDPVAAAEARRMGPKTTLKHRLKAVLSHPVGWQAFFIHFASLVPQAIFTLLWGVPLMTQAMGLSDAQAGAALTVNTLAVIAASPLFGVISSRLGTQRDFVVIAIVVINIASWLVFFGSESPRGFAAAVLINLMLGTCTPVSNFGFDYVRERMPRENVATGTGVGNMGGFTAAMIAAQLMGFVLAHSAAAPGALEWQDFRASWLVLVAIMAIGLVAVAASGLAMRRHARAQAGGSQPRK